jgi:Tfp pilus assembly protein PilV
MKASLCGDFEMSFSRVKRVAAKKPTSGNAGERGFTLIETTIALVVMMIVMLAAASLFAYAVYHNSSGVDRAQTLAVAQESMERFRSAAFSKSKIDAILSQGRQTQTGVARGGTNGVRYYDIMWIIEDTTPTVKTITVQVTPTGAGMGGATPPLTIMTQRSMSDQ